MTDVTIFHNPDCGTSRNTLALIRHAGIEPQVVEYLKTPPSTQEVRQFLAEMNISAQQLLREKGHALRGARLVRPEMVGRPAAGLHPTAFQPNEPPSRSDTPRHETLPSFRGRP